ncbi:hypothetical protein EDD18DRAFT_1359658 [Armillaria luteobubalina]|uniref:Heterokaryon incompatibility domain-containing protein n=1 Tax=Armillaria luteobubalina TaxID=153913 RepID=A0AA39PQ97_9AGAR|nr:hypothetical protein EDD18DRAFT_1359658 [Armillaria luteobubalina]
MSNIDDRTDMATHSSPEEVILHTYSNTVTIDPVQVRVETASLGSMPNEPPTSESQCWFSPSRVTSDSDLQHTKTTAHSESQEVIIHNSSAMSQPRKDLLSTLPRLIIPQPRNSISQLRNSISQSRNSDTAFPEVTISAFNETGQVESSIKVPLQRSYTGTKPVIPSSLADTPCASLGTAGLLDLFNTILRTSHTLDTPSLCSVLQDCIRNNYDFGTAYGRLRTVWPGGDHYGDIQDNLHRREVLDWYRRENALVRHEIIKPYLQPRRVWDLYANRVVPWWVVDRSNPDRDSTIRMSAVNLWKTCVRPISHAWVDAKDRVDVQTPINRHEWPVSIPTDACLDLIRIEMLNLGVEYTWLDVLCLRQKNGTREDLRNEEWKLDVPTIGSVYLKGNGVVIYLSGLGRPFTLKEGDLESDRCWFRRAWTLQEVGERRVIAGDMPDGPLHAGPIDEGDTVIMTRFQKHLKAIKAIHPGSEQSSLSPGMFGVLSEMQNRVSTNPVDKVAGLAIPLLATTLPAYYESQRLEDAWTTLLNVMHRGNRGELFFWYPEPGDAGKKWRPSWDQVMKKPLPADKISDGMNINRDDKTDDDWHEGLVGQGLVRGLAAGGVERDIRYGELIVKDADGIEHTFNIIAHHGYPIPEGTYTLLGSNPAMVYMVSSYSLVRTQYWVIGQTLLDEKFEKLSVFEMVDKNEVRRLNDLHITEERRIVLV